MWKKDLIIRPPLYQQIIFFLLSLWQLSYSQGFLLHTSKILLCFGGVISRGRSNHSYSHTSSSLLCVTWWFTLSTSVSTLRLCFGHLETPLTLSDRNIQGWGYMNVVKKMLKTAICSLSYSSRCYQSWCHFFIFNAYTMWPFSLCISFKFLSSFILSGILFELHFNPYWLSFFMSLLFF